MLTFVNGILLINVILFYGSIINIFTAYLVDIFLRNVDDASSKTTRCFYKILFGYVDVSSDEFFASSPAVHTRGHPYKLLKKKHSTTRSRQTFFSERVINVWNYLPYDIECFNSLNAFKRSIVRVNFKSFLQCY